MAEADGEVVGHVLLSRVSVGERSCSRSPRSACCPGHKSVRPRARARPRRARGARARRRSPSSWSCGSPSYYGKLGFEPARRLGLKCPFEVAARGVARGAAAGLGRRRELTRHGPLPGDLGRVEPVLARRCRGDRRDACRPAPHSAPAFDTGCRAGASSAAWACSAVERRGTGRRWRRSAAAGVARILDDAAATPRSWRAPADAARGDGRGSVDAADRRRRAGSSRTRRRRTCFRRLERCREHRGGGDLGTAAMRGGRGPAALLVRPGVEPLSSSNATDVGRSARRPLDTAAERCGCRSAVIQLSVRPRAARDVARRPR